MQKNQEKKAIQQFIPLAVSRGKGREISAHFLLTFNRGVPISTHAFENFFLQIIYKIMLNQFWNWK